MFRVIKPEKILEKRGSRTRKAIAELVDNKLTEMDLYGYEKGKWSPSQEKLKYLLKALDTTFDEISEPVDLALN